MPYSEFHQMTKGKLESTQSKLSNCSADLAFVPDDEFAELVWENGQILMQGQSNRSRKSPPCTGFSSLTSKDREKDEGDTLTTKNEKFGTVGSILNDFSTSGLSGHMELGQADELIRWLNYPLDDYDSELFSDLSGVNLNVHSAHNNALMIDKNTSNSQIVRDSHMVPVYAGGNPEQDNESKFFREDSVRRNSQLCSPPLQQCQTSLPVHRSRVSNFIATTTNSANKTPSGNSTSRLMNTTMQKQNTIPPKPPLQPSKNKGFMNFSHFLRPSALVKSNLQSIGTGPDSSSIDTFRSDDKMSNAGSSNPVESTVIESTSGSRSITGFQSQPVSKPGKVDVNSSMGKPPKEPFYAKPPEAICREDASWKKRSLDQVLGQTSSFAASAAIERPHSGKDAEPVVASSSVCSGNSAGGASNDPKHALKRKSRDTEEPEYPSEDVEEESVARKTTSAREGTGTKRSRAAEVHNLSERRRRDRINEKMRALQELIPNCNKGDKASMLDEAIEYLKTLQLQVQIMSMGTGLCVPPMMLPTGMQQMHAPHMAHFSPMGMGMGCGMGMLDMSGGSSGCPLIQVPPMHGAQFHCTPISGTSSLPMMTGSGLQMFGFPGQGLPMSVPYAPFIPLSGGPSEKSITLPVVSGAVTPLEAPGPALPSSSKDPTEDMNPQMMPKTSVECSQKQTSTQCQATKGGSEQSVIVQRNDQTMHVCGD